MESNLTSRGILLLTDCASMKAKSSSLSVGPKTGLAMCTAKGTMLATTAMSLSNAA